MKKLIISAALLLGLGLSATSYGQNEGEWRIRLRGTAVVPSASGSLSVPGTGTIPGSVGISSSFIPEVDFTYFFVNRVSANLILGTTHHKVTAKDPAGLGDIPLGKVWLLPPTLTFLYHQPFDKGHILPYIGAGVNYTIFYSKSDINTPITSVSYKNHFGFATQIGSDFDISKKWFINADIKKIFLKTSNSVGNAVTTPEPIVSNTKINPWLFSLGIGVKL